MISIHDLLKKMIEKRGSDLHIVSGFSPVFRINGMITPASQDVLSPELTVKLAYSIMTESQQKRFEVQKELDFSFGIASLGRFRANVYYQRGSISIALRYIPYEIKKASDLGLPKSAMDLVERTSGLILVTGATGSGKSTTLSSMLDIINSSKHGHILTIEDPIEFVHKHKKCIVSQREVYSDTETFGSALRVALRQDPDYVLIGEMRDTETMRAALSIAETGHLTFASLHTNSAVQTINRIVDSFPDSEQAQIRTQLSFVLQGVLSQILIPDLQGGRTLATELLIATPAIKSMIRDEKLHQVQSMLETGQKFGMHTLDACLAGLVLSRRIDKFEANIRCTDIESFNRLLSGKLG